jgi:hypothetical protein
MEMLTRCLTQTLQENMDDLLRSEHDKEQIAILFRRFRSF